MFSRKIRKMIELFIFHLHAVAAIYGFVKRWQSAGLKEGFLAILLFGLCFTIVWALTGQISRLLMPNSSPNNMINADSLSLIMAAIPDFYFFYVFFLKQNQHDQ